MPQRPYEGARAGKVMHGLVPPSLFYQTVGRVEECDSQMRAGVCRYALPGSAIVLEAVNLTGVASLCVMLVFRLARIGFGA
jgi:putative component of membrane protein insertase Oxa1/YidC/SpoIIIJ protein YidD